MSGIIAPLALPQHSAAPPRGHGHVRLARRALRLSDVPLVRTAQLFYDFAAVDVWGRVIAPSAIGSLAWTVGTRVDLRERSGVIIASECQDGKVVITRSRELRLPLPVRRWLQLDGGTRVLVVGDPGEARLVVHPLSSLDSMVVRRHAEILRGEDA